MNLQQATNILLFDTMDDDGLYIKLRLGIPPSAQKALQLRIALRVIWRSLLTCDRLPRDIAFACAVIINYGEECHRNYHRQHGHVDEHFNLTVRDLVQGAFDVLAGEQATMWSVPRPDLGDPVEPNQFDSFNDNVR